MPQKHNPRNGFLTGTPYRSQKTNGYAVKLDDVQSDMTDETASRDEEKETRQRELPESVLTPYYNHKVLTRPEEKKLNKEMRLALAEYRYEVLSSGFAASLILSVLTEKKPHDAIGLDYSWLFEEVYPAWRYAHRNKEAIMARVQKTRELLSSGDYANKELIRVWEEDCVWYRKMLSRMRPTARLLDFCLEGYGDVRGLQHYRELPSIATTTATKNSHCDIQKNVALETLVLPDRLQSLLTRAEKARATFFEKRDIFFLHNLKFTRIIVSELADLLPFTYNNFIDLESVGNQGTQKAIERFKANRARFSTYARYWIYQSALREIQRTGRGIRLPVSIQKKIRSLRRIIAGLQEEEGDDYEPNVNELAALTDVPKQIITSYLQKDFETVSIHAPLGDDGDEIAAFVEDVTQLPAYEEVHRKGYKIAIEELLASLTLREASVLRERYGLNEDGVPKTLEQVGKEKRITRERIRQIQKKALNKLRLRIERKEYEFTGQGSRISREDMV